MVFNTASDCVTVKCQLDVPDSWKVEVLSTVAVGTEAG